jgi:hypothetical protein
MWSFFIPMEELDPKTKKKLERLAKLKDDSDLVIMDAIDELEEKVEQYKQEIPDLNKVLESVRGEQGIQGVQGEQGETGQDGYTPVKGVDYFTQNEILEVARKATGMIKIPKDGRDGREIMHIGSTPPKNPQKGDLWYQD